MAGCAPGKSALHGTGLFSLQTMILAGGRILSEAPLVECKLLVEDDAASTVVHKLLDDLSRLQRTNATTVYWLAKKNGKVDGKSADQWTEELRNHSPDALNGAVDTFFQASINYSSSNNGKMTGLFKTLNLVNHSCTPNAARYWNDKQQQMELRAISDIEPGKEILVTYIDQFNSREQRHSDLGFACVCPVCRFGGAVLQVFEDCLRRLRKSFTTLKEFQLQYFGGKPFEESSRSLVTAIVGDGNLETALDAAKNVIEIITDVFHLNSMRLATAYRVIYVIRAAHAIFRNDSDRFYDTAYSSKILELNTLAVCRGIKHPESLTVLQRLLNHARARRVATGSEEPIRWLANVLGRSGSSLETMALSQKVIGMKAKIRDGPNDSADEVWAHL